MSNLIERIDHIIGMQAWGSTPQERITVANDIARIMIETMREHTQKWDMSVGGHVATYCLDAFAKETRPVSDLTREELEERLAKLEWSLEQAHSANYSEQARVDLREKIELHKLALKGLGTEGATRQALTDLWHHFSDLDKAAETTRWTGAMSAIFCYMHDRGLPLSVRTPPPDANCLTAPDGSCVSSGPCMHTPPDDVDGVIERLEKFATWPPIPNFGYSREQHARCLIKEAATLLAGIREERDAQLKARIVAEHHELEYRNLSEELKAERDSLCSQLKETREALGWIEKTSSEVAIRATARAALGDTK